MSSPEGIPLGLDSDPGSCSKKSRFGVLSPLRSAYYAPCGASLAGLAYSSEIMNTYRNTDRSGNEACPDFVKTYFFNPLIRARNRTRTRFFSLPFSSHDGCFSRYRRMIGRVSERRATSLKPVFSNVEAIPFQMNAAACTLP